MRELFLLLVALTVHECGHMLVASALSIPVRSFNICSVGAVLSFDFSRVGYVKETVVHLSGAAFGAVFGIVAYLIFGGRAYYFTGLSLALSAVNLLPVAGFDGEGVARCILSLFLFPDTVWRICRVMSVCSIVALWTTILWIELRAGGNLGLLIFIIGIMLGKMK